VIRTSGDEVANGVRALALDYGFEAGAEAEFQDLLRQVLSEVAADGSGELTLFTSPGTRGNEPLTSMASRVEEFVFGGDMAAELDPESTSPIYVDQLYF
jgi:hypothetical protein